MRLDLGIGYLRNLEDIGVLYTKRKGSVLNQRVGFHCVVLVLSLNWLMTSVSCIKGEKKTLAFQGHVWTGNKRNLGRGPKDLPKANSTFC